MDHPKGSGRDYVRKVQEDTRRYIKELLSKNEHLEALGELHVHQNAQLKSEVAALREALAAREREFTRLTGELSHIRDERRRLAEEYGQVESQNSSLGSLYVATYRLHSTLDRGEILTAIQEIVSNLIGCEEMVVFELSEDGRTLVRAGFFGVEAHAFLEVPVGEGVIGRTAQAARVFVPGRDGEASGAEAGLTASIPLKVDGKVVGVMALFRLLSHKPALEAVDFELFDLLESQAGIALYASGLWARSLAPPR